MLVNLQMMQFFNEQFGTEEGSNYKDFMREAREQDSGEIVVELRFRKIQLLAFPNKTKFK